MTTRCLTRLLAGAAAGGALFLGIAVAAPATDELKTTAKRAL
ncbi:MAG: hypothetical protein WD076_03655 [Parvularculaceae bacterium]